MSASRILRGIRLAYKLNISIEEETNQAFLDNISEERNVLLCATHRFEAARFHEIVKTIDKSAFIVTMEAGEIFGEGFNNFEST